MIKIAIINIDNKKMISIIHGYACSSSSWCDCRSKCKHTGGFKFHNWSVTLHRFFKYHFNIELPHWIYINKEFTDLSGTTKCPFHKSRRYTCWVCKFNFGESCINPKRKTATKDELDFVDKDWGKCGRCGLFEKESWADDYDKHNGKII